MVDDISITARNALPEAQATGPEIRRADKTGAHSKAPRPRARLACRLVAEKDLEPAIDLLAAGFPERKAAYWRRALERLRDRDVPEGRPRYGYVMTDRDRLVGIILIIFAETDKGLTRGNVSSWYVEPDYRGLSHLLLAAPLKLKDVTLFNISPTRSAIETIRAQGFAKYSGGSFQAIAALAPSVAGAGIRRITAESQNALPILVEHAAWGCLSFEVTHEGKTYPFIFVASKILGGKVSCAELVYCADIGDIVRFAGVLGRRLLRLGLPILMVDADEPLPGLVGSQRQGRALRYFRGNQRPRVGDLSYSELAIFGP